HWPPIRIRRSAQAFCTLQLRLAERAGVAGSGETHGRCAAVTHTLKIGNLGRANMSEPSRFEMRTACYFCGVVDQDRDVVGAIVGHGQVSQPVPIELACQASSRGPRSPSTKSKRT